MNILIAGGTGQIGRELQSSLTTLGHQVFAFGSLDMNIIYPDRISAKIATLPKIDLLINCAAYTAVDQAESEAAQADAVNHIGAKNLAIFCAKNNIPLIHISTDYIFNGEKTAYAELDTPDPLNVYGKTKWLGELAIKTHCANSIILRVSWVFSRYRVNFVKNIIRLLKERKELRVVDDQFGCPTAAMDIARVICLLLEKCFNKETMHFYDDATGVYHYCGAPQTTWFGFSKKILEYAKTHQLIEEDRCIYPTTSAEFVTKAKRPTNSVLVIDKIKKILNVTPGSWEKDLHAVIEQIAQDGA
jgi:dTDP-4-dehydrorhamnose reductase